MRARTRSATSGSIVDGVHSACRSSTNARADAGVRARHVELRDPVAPPLLSPLRWRGHGRDGRSPGPRRSAGVSASSRMVCRTVMPWSPNPAGSPRHSAGGVRAKNASDAVPSLTAGAEVEQVVDGDPGRVTEPAQPGRPGRGDPARLHEELVRNRRARPAGCARASRAASGIFTSEATGNSRSGSMPISSPECRSRTRKRPREPARRRSVAELADQALDARTVPPLIVTAGPMRRPSLAAPRQRAIVLAQPCAGCAPRRPPTAAGTSKPRARWISPTGRQCRPSSSACLGEQRSRSRRAQRPPPWRR